jgi:hypothetical protein
LKYAWALVRELLVGGEVLEENEDEDAVSCEEEDLDEIAFGGSGAR